MANLEPRQLAHDFCRHASLIAPTAFVAPNATVMGLVEIGHQSSVWFGAVLRGDVERIQIGEESNIQDQCVLHADPGFPCVIGNRVTVGHGAVVHGALVEDESLIGIRAVVLNGAKIGRGSIVGAGCVVPENFVVPANSVVMGVPAKIIRSTNAEDQKRSQQAVENYIRAKTVAAGVVK